MGNYPDRTGSSAFIDLIDLTPSIQKNVDWDRVAKAGFKGVFIQSSRYSSTPELAYDKYAEAAKSAGLAVGGYHFAACDSDPIQQAEFFLRRLASHGLNPGDLPPVLDLEYATQTLKSKGRAYVVNWAVMFLVRLERELLARGQRRLPVLYTFPAFGQSLEPEIGILSRWPLMLARYANSGLFYPPDDWRPDLVPKGLRDPVVVQYSGNTGYPVPGVGPCDRDVFIGSSGDWQDFLGLDRPPDGVELPTYD